MKKLDHLKTISLSKLRLTKDSHSVLQFWVASTRRPRAAIIEDLIRHAVHTDYKPSTTDLRFDSINKK